MWRGYANVRSLPRPAKSCGGGLAGCRCNIDYTAECFVDYCSVRRRCYVCCIILLHSAKKVVVLWALGRLTTPHAGTGQRAPVASIDILRMTAVEHRAHTRSSSSSSSSTRSRSVVCYFSLPASRIEAVGFVFFKFL